jgi:hypothetical protein
MSVIEITVRHVVEMSSATIEAPQELARAVIFAASNEVGKMDMGAPGADPLFPDVAEQKPPPPAADSSEKPQSSASPQPPMLADVAVVETTDELKAEPAPVETKGALAPHATWTTERDDVLRRGYPGGVPTQDLLTAVNALPGKHVYSSAPLSSRVDRLGLRRPPGWDAGRQRVVLQAAAAPKAVTPAAAPPAHAASTPAPSVRTADRERLLRFRYVAGDAIEHITTALNELPGAPMHPGAVVAWIGALDLKRGPAAEAALRPQRPPSSPPAIRPSPVPAQAPSKRMTPERQALLERDWPTNRPSPEIIEEFNRLPGPPMPADQLAIYASKLGLRRPSAGRVQQDAAGDRTHEDATKHQREASPTVDWPAAFQWARNNNVGIPEGTSLPTARILINDARHKMGLPQWTIVESSKRLEFLPSPHFGADDHRRAE